MEDSLPTPQASEGFDPDAKLRLFKSLVCYETLTILDHNFYVKTYPYLLSFSTLLFFKCATYNLYLYFHLRSPYNKFYQ